MFRWQIYFAGPKTRWLGRPDPAEIIADGVAPWRWLARAAMQSAFRQLDADKCGYVLARNDEALEQYDPPTDPVPA